MCTQSSASTIQPNFIFRRSFYVRFDEEFYKAEDLKEIYWEDINDVFST